MEENIHTGVFNFDSDGEKIQQIRIHAET